MYCESTEMRPRVARRARSFHGIPHGKATSLRRGKWKNVARVLPSAAAANECKCMKHGRRKFAFKYVKPDRLMKGLKNRTWTSAMIKATRADIWDAVLFLLRAF